MQGQNIIRTLLFVVFFGVGAAAVGGSVLCDDLVRYYRNKHFLNQAKGLSDRLESLNADYDALLRKLEDDPNLIRRIAPATIGAEHEDPNTVYPRATAAQLSDAKKTLAGTADQEPNEPAMPTWLVRSSEPRQRILLFLCGAALIFVSFICFGPAKRASDQEQ
ncbi:unnamed protein product [marine sediment metagenome]|uniref:Uncharacterized protein n=1 Tax=marine sediment metagenome TaxID=412755 RepID=X1U0I2_9ZZZZ